MTKLEAKLSRRKAMTVMAAVGGTTVFLPHQWSKPILDAVVLPAHAQTSMAMCVTDTTVGGPLIGHPSGAATCQAACEAEAVSQNAELCAVDESVDASGATQCECELDLPD